VAERRKEERRWVKEVVRDGKAGVRILDLCGCCCWMKWRFEKMVDRVIGFVLIAVAREKIL
jgi:hypothetical protein